MHGKDMFADLAIKEIREQIAHFCDLGIQVIDQARRRILDGEQVPNSEKIYSIFEPHTDLIKRGKVRTPIEFGHKVFLAESAQGLITQYEVLKGNPSDEIHVVPSLRRHKQVFGRAPEIYGTDRGFFSEQNLASCQQAWCQGGAHPAAWWQENQGSRSLREQCALQESSALSRRHRGAHLGSIPRSWHEAVSRPRSRALRSVGR